MWAWPKKLKHKTVGKFLYLPLPEKMEAATGGAVLRLQGSFTDNRWWADIGNWESLADASSGVPSAPVFVTRGAFASQTGSAIFNNDQIVAFAALILETSQGSTAQAEIEAFKTEAALCGHKEKLAPALSVELVERNTILDQRRNPELTYRTLLHA